MYHNRELYFILVKYRCILFKIPTITLKKKVQKKNMREILQFFRSAVDFSLSGGGAIDAAALAVSQVSSEAGAPLRR